MAKGATREQDRRVVGRMGRGPTALLAWLLWAMIVTLGKAVVVPYQIDWFSLTHLSDLTGPHIFGALMGPIFVLVILAFASVGALVVTLRPKNGVGWLCVALSLICVLAGVPPGVDTYGVPWYVLEPASSVA